MLTYNIQVVKQVNGYLFDIEYFLLELLKRWLAFSKVSALRCLICSLQRHIYRWSNYYCAFVSGFLLSFVRNLSWKSGEIHSHAFETQWKCSRVLQMLSHEKGTGM